MTYFVAIARSADSVYSLRSGCVMAELDPTNYMTFYRRATVYLAMGKSKSALPDLDVVLSLKPDFNAVCCLFHTLVVLVVFVGSIIL